MRTFKKNSKISPLALVQSAAWTQWELQGEVHPLSKQTSRETAKGPTKCPHSHSPPRTPPFCMQQLEWLFSEHLIRSLLCLKAKPCDGFPFHSGQNSLSLPYNTLQDLAPRSLLFASPTVACPQSSFQYLEGAESPQGLPTCHSPAWKMSPHFTPH